MLMSRLTLAALAGVLAISLAGCDGARTEDESAAQPTANVDLAASTPSLPSVTPPAATGDALASAAESYAADETPLGLVERDDGQPGRAFDVIDCGEEGRAVDPHDAPLQLGEIVARRVALLRRSLRLIGYSAAVIDQPLADYADAVARDPAPDHGDEPYARLAAALDSNRAALQPNLPPILAQGGCGAAETPIIVRSRPAGGHVWLITKFAFDLCRARRMDAWDRIACDRWSEIGPDRPVQLSGNYVYQVEWPGGRRTRGNRRIDATDADEDSPPPIVTVD